MKRLNIVVALPAEARPFISFYSLKKSSQRHPFPIYFNADKTIYLIVSGIGKVKSAAAVVYLNDVANACYLNVGIAGCGGQAVGELFLVNKIIDAATQRAFFPSASLMLGHGRLSLTTYDQPQTSYVDEGMVDMEGAGFFEAASLLVSQEQCQVIKVISDNVEHSIESISKDFVESLLVDKIADIDLVVQQLLSLSEKELGFCADQVDVEAFRRQWHFSQYQLHQLRELLRRWSVVFSDQDPVEVCLGVKSARGVLVRLEEVLERALVLW